MSDQVASIPQIDKGTITVEQLAKDTSDRFNKNEILIYSVLAIVAATLVATFVGATALIIDQLHFNNELYRDGDYNHVRTVQTTERVEQPVVFFPKMKP